jgi:FixJ family two-component response regulator
MPGISGDAIAERLHQIDPALPVLLMTGDSGDAFAAGARLPVLHKPFSHEDLITAMHTLAHSRRPNACAPDSLDRLR